MGLTDSTARSADRPALEGGTPVRDEPLAFALVDVGTEEEQAVVEALRSGWLSTGPRTELFEREMAALLGAPHALGVSSCTSGLHLLLRAAGVGPGDEVITSPVSFPATAAAIVHCGATPVLADVLPGELTLDPEAVEAAVTPRTRALLVVHLAGWPCRMDELNAIASARGLVVIEDAAHALGTRYRGRSAGTLGDGAAFSFYATKNLTTGEGGLITTRHDDWCDRMRVERLHGLDLDASRREGQAYQHWEAVSLGWKYNMSDLAAAIGLAQLPKFAGFLARRRQLDLRYRESLSGEPALRMLVGPEGAETSAHLFPILIEPGALRIDRDRMLQALVAENIGVGVHFRALPLHRYFRDELGCDPGAVPVAVEATERVFSVPLHTRLTDREQDDVVEALRRIVRYYAV